MRVIQNAEIEVSSWNSFLQKTSFSSPFQTPAFYNFYNSIPGYSANVFGIEDNGEIKALTVVTLQKEKGPKAYFSRRGIIYGGPLCISSEPNIIKLLLTFLNSFYKGKVIYLESRNFFDYNVINEAFVSSGWDFVPYLNFQLNLEGKTLDDLYGGMQYNRKREIRLSLQEGTTYHECKDDHNLVSVYDILKDLYKTRVKLPLPDLDFFRIMLNQGICKVFFVKHNDQIIGGSICPYLPGKAIYTYYYCGLRNYHKKIFPTHLAIVAAMDFAIKNSIKYIDFMGAGKPEEEYGVRSYKKEFGGELVEHGRFMKVLNPLMYNIGKIGLKIISKIN
jgi:serine/alanine adding enzyme